MLEYALRGDRRYWSWICALLGIMVVAFLFYLRQASYGLGITGLGRDVPWGLYIAQFTFLVGVAASSVMVVLPYYLHDFREFGKLTILGELLVIPSIIMCMVFVIVDMGQPSRILNVLLYPTPHSMMFWDMVVLGVYLLLNIIISRVVLDAERKSIPPPGWIRPIIILSIPWAFSIHTVTAFLYSGLAARPFWLTAILAPRFLASAFAAGPALLILFCVILRKVSRFDAGHAPLQKLAVIVTYAMTVNVFLMLVEIFTAMYSDIPEHVRHFQLMYFGLEGNASLVPWMWVAAVLAVLALVLLINPRTRRNEPVLILACSATFISLWIDKGLAMVITGFIPSPLAAVPKYRPTVPETLISLGIYASGLLIVTVLYKIALSVRERLAV